VCVGESALADLHDYIDELRQLAVGVVLVRCARPAANFGQKEVNTKGQPLVNQALLQRV